MATVMPSRWRCAWQSLATCLSRIALFFDAVQSHHDFGELKCAWNICEESVKNPWNRNTQDTILLNLPPSSWEYGYNFNSAWKYSSRKQLKFGKSLSARIAKKYDTLQARANGTTSFLLTTYEIPGVCLSLFHSPMTVWVFLLWILLQLKSNSEDSPRGFRTSSWGVDCSYISSDIFLNSTLPLVFLEATFDRLATATRFLTQLSWSWSSLDMHPYFWLLLMYCNHILLYLLDSAHPTWTFSCRPIPCLMCTPFNCSIVWLLSTHSTDNIH